MTDAPLTTHVNKTHINAPIDTVWSILTRTDQALPFFFGAICEAPGGLTPGRKMRMVSPNRKVAMVVGEVIAFEPPRLYSHSFTMTNIDEPPAVVTYRLTPAGAGTDFELVIERSVPGSKLEKEMLSAQGFIASNLKSLAERGRPAFTGRLVGLLGPVFAALAKQSQRVEHWPLD